MVWFKIDDKFHGHPKAGRRDRRAGCGAAGSYCGAYLTDGFVAAEFVDSMPAVANSRPNCGGRLWMVVDGGWQFHEWRATTRPRLRWTSGGKDQETPATGTTP